MYRDYTEEQIDELIEELESERESAAGERAFEEEVRAFVQGIAGGQGRA
jgi:hypothetical protein